MKRAHLRDAVRTQKFHFRKHIAPPTQCSSPRNSEKSAKQGSSGGMTNTERDIASAIAAEVAGYPCGPCNAQVSQT